MDKKFSPHILFETTQECNLSCRYCYNYWRRAGSKLEKSTFRKRNKTISYLLKHVPFNTITFTGGEPLLVNGLAEHVLKCRLKGKQVNIISNGTMGKMEDYAVLSDLGVSLFEFPLHSSDAAIHDSLTDQEGCFDKVLTAIETVNSLQSELCVVCVITKLNADKILSMLEFARDLGVTRILLARFNIGGRGVSNINTLVPSLEQLRHAFTVAEDFVKHSSLKISANVCVPHCVINPRDYPHLHISSCTADVTRMPLTIDFKGDVRMCNHSPNIIGNIFKETLTDLFQSDQVTKWARVLPDTCQSCRVVSTCRGGCKAAGEQMNLPENSCDPIVVEMGAELIV